MQQHTTSGLIVVLSSPSGGGKSSLTQSLLELNGNFKKSISVTTRPKRDGEIEGVDYYFKTREEFDRLIKDNQFLEYAEIYGNLYGTLKEKVLNDTNSGIDLLFDVDWQGARAIKQITPKVISIFILPPSIEVLRQRLIARGQDTPEIIEYRIAEAQNEINHMNEYDYSVVNDDFQSTLTEIYKIIMTRKSAQFSQA